MVTALCQVGVGDPLDETTSGDEIQFRNLKLGAADRADVVGQEKPVQPDRHGLGIVQLDPVAIPVVGHPLIDDKAGSGGQQRGRLVLPAGRD